MSVEQWAITDRDEWLRRRAVDLTASDIGAVAGVDEHRTALRVFLEKSGQAIANPENDAMRRGRWLEPAVIAAVREEHADWDVKPARVYLRDGELRLGATPDALVLDPARSGVGNLQLKVVARPVFERDWADGQVPLKFQLQTLTEAMLADAEWCAVAALVIDVYSAELVIRDVPRHAAAEARIRRMAEVFWNMVASGSAPAPNYAHDGELIKQLYAKAGGAPKDLSGDERVAQLCEEQLSWSRRKHNAEAALETVNAELCAILGNAERAEHPDFNISWKLQSRKETLLPATSFRVLRITRKGKRAGDEQPVEVAA